MATADAIQDAGSYGVRLRGGLRGRITGTFAGQRDPATDRWSGTWAVKVRVTRRGKTVRPMPAQAGSRGGRDLR